ncbi:MAG: ribonuclease III [Clostridia bacterium]|nr:ribonuclease III [Clostridia bacterium]
MLNEFEKKINYKFKNIALLQRALTHSSYANECKDGRASNERLEFLGDSVLSIVVSDHIFRSFTNRPEGELTKLRANLVCERSLAAYAREIDLGEYLMLGRGEKLTGGDKRDSILSDAFEAVIAAIYLDGGLEAAAEHIMRFVSADLSDGVAGSFVDYKTLLQEKVQRSREGRVEYILVKEEGPDHMKSFTVQAVVDGKVVGEGVGQNKKKAEQLAAKQALGEEN